MFFSIFFYVVQHIFGPSFCRSPGPRFPHGRGAASRPEGGRREGGSPLSAFVYLAPAKVYGDFNFFQTDCIFKLPVQLRQPLPLHALTSPSPRTLSALSPPPPRTKKGGIAAALQLFRRSSKSLSLDASKILARNISSKRFSIFGFRPFE